MKKETKLFEIDSIIYDDNIEIVGEDRTNEAPIMRMNISSSFVDSLRGCLENIKETLKDVPDMKLKELPEYETTNFDGEPSESNLSDEIESALKFVREMDDVIFPISQNYYENKNKQNDMKDTVKWFQGETSNEMLKKQYPNPENA